ncbi:MAG: ATP-binding protein [Mesorhizobium sp.]|nr:ATP-binding protein [Mesorhizobium sp.]
MVSEGGILFEERFLDKHAGQIISDTEVAIVELVANCWDAYATEVNISWPDASAGIAFQIADNGKGMTQEMFDRCWRKLDYDRIANDGKVVEPPGELENSSPRKAYGRNGRGRHAAFRFSDPYVVRTWRDGTEATYEVRRGAVQPFDIKLLQTRNDVTGHGTIITATAPTRLMMSSEEAKQALGMRFLADPNFKVAIDGSLVSFADLPALSLHELDVEVPPHGKAHMTVVDAEKSDRTMLQHGIAWRVNNRLVGSPGWVSFDHSRILDGRTKEARRFQFIVEADFLEDCVLPDWSSFNVSDAAWQKTQDAVHSAVHNYISSVTAGRRQETKAAVYNQLSSTVRQMPPASRDVWNQFVDQVVDSCPTISASEVEQVAGILANLEIANSKYGLVSRLHQMKPGDLDELHQILIDWNVRTAKLALDEIQSRLRLIQELDTKLRDPRLEEVADLQPLFDRSLWVFGPEFEAIDFTSNRGMTTVIQSLFGAKEKASLLRPDYVILPNGSVGFYSRDHYDTDHEVAGIARLVVAEIKRVGVVIGDEQKNQAWKYVTELIERGLIDERTQATCFVLGSRVSPTQASERIEWEGRVKIRPMSYDTFISRASARMLGLREKLKDAPFLKAAGVDAEAFIEPPGQIPLDLVGAVAH